MITLLIAALFSTTLGVPLSHRENPFQSWVVNGVPAALGEFPYMVGIGTTSTFGSYTSFFCGGALLNENWVLTAASCNIGREPADIRLVMGSLKLSTLNPTVQNTTASLFLSHESYDDNTLFNNVAVIKLSHSVIFSPYISAVTLPQPGEDVTPGTVCDLCGYGTHNKRKRYQHGPTADALEKVKVPIITMEKCHKEYDPLAASNPLDVLDDKMMICAGWDEGGRDSCAGDDGTILLCDGKAVGLVSKGNGCANAGFAGIYTKISAYVDWINAKIASHPETN